MPSTLIQKGTSPVNWVSDSMEWERPMFACLRIELQTQKFMKVEKKLTRIDDTGFW